MESTIKLTDSQKRIQAWMLGVAKKRNNKGQGYQLGHGYNANWHKLLDVLVEWKTLRMNTAKRKRYGFWVLKWSGATR
jgi:hypothetical protein